MAKAVVDRSDGQLRMFAGKYFVTDELMKYIVESKRLVGVVKQSPLLELRSLKLNNTYVTVQELTAVLENCPVLEVLRVHNCFEIDVDEEEHALRAKFARTMTIWCDDEYRLYFD
ncbi:putative F-box/LRR-repeat protein 23 [Hordeum vulgare]|nr:putative F-box/LRR-repeat protein 23 [Hordeum vulgare]